MQKINNSGSIINNKLQHNNRKQNTNRTWLRYICHQRPERCYYVNGKPMPICSRCFGVYLGVILGMFIPFLISNIYLFDVKNMYILFILGLIPMAIDGGTQFFGIRKSNNHLRFITGLLAGIVVGILFHWIIYKILV